MNIKKRLNKTIVSVKKYLSHVCHLGISSYQDNRFPLVFLQI